MKINGLSFAGKYFMDVETQVELFYMANTLPICTFHTSYNVGSKPEAWWTYQGISMCVKASFEDRKQLEDFMTELNWSDRLKPGQAESVFEEMLKIAVDSPALPE